MMPEIKNDDFVCMLVGKGCFHCSLPNVVVRAGALISFYSYVPYTFISNWSDIHF